MCLISWFWWVWVFCLGFEEVYYNFRGICVYCDVFIIFCLWIFFLFCMVWICVVVLDVLMSWLCVWWYVGYEGIFERDCSDVIYNVGCFGCLEYDLWFSCVGLRWFWFFLFCVIGGFVLFFFVMIFLYLCVNCVNFLIWRSYKFL